MPVFNQAALQLQNGGIDWVNDDIRARLVLTSESIDIDADVMTGLGVTGNDTALANRSGPTLSDAADRIIYDADDVVFVAQGASAEVDRILVFQFNTNDADSVPIAINAITPVTPNGGNITVTINAAGVFYTQQ